MSLRLISFMWNICRMTYSCTVLNTILNCETELFPNIGLFTYDVTWQLIVSLVGSLANTRHPVSTTYLLERNFPRRPSPSVVHSTDWFLDSSCLCPRLYLKCWVVGEICWSSIMGLQTNVLQLMPHTLTMWLILWPTTETSDKMAFWRWTVHLSNVSRGH